HARTEILNQDVGELDQAFEDFNSARAGKIERDAALAAIGGIEDRRALYRLHLRRRHRERTAPPVEVMRIFDLDYLGAHLGEHLTGQRPRPSHRDVEHANLAVKDCLHIVPAFASAPIALSLSPKRPPKISRLCSPSCGAGREASPRCDVRRNGVPGTRIVPSTGSSIVSK